MKKLTSNKGGRFATSLITTFIATFATLIALLLPQQASAGYTVDTNSMNMTEMWWDSNESGWGAAVIHRGNIMFIAMYTYDPSGLPKWYVVSRCEISGNGCTGELLDVIGGVPLTSVWGKPNITERVVGNFTMTFTDNNYGSMSGTIDGVAWQKNISRMLFGSVPCTSPQVLNSTWTACVDPTPVSGCLPPTMQNSKGACMLPPAPTGYTWNNVIKAWVADIGVLVTGVNTLPATCVTIGDACWLDSIADGTIKLTNTNAVATGVNTRPIVFASYIVGNSSFFGYYVSVPLYADEVSKSAFLNQNVENGGVNAPIADVKGSASGLKQNFLSAGCWERVWGGNGAWGNISISCPI